jgi:hypothetical protein
MMSIHELGSPDHPASRIEELMPWNWKRQKPETMAA